MTKKKSTMKMWIGLLAVVMIFSFGLGGNGYCQDNDPHKTGLRAPTQEELEWQNKHMIRVKKVKLNPLGLERVNQWRKQNGLNTLSEEESGVVEKGKDIEGTIGEAPLGETSGVESSLIGLPPYVDNSTRIYFPPIRSQGSIGSCACFSSTYYTMTYMYSWQNGIDAKNGNDTNRFSPKWTYNMINGGEDTGSWFSGAYNIALKHGPATWTEFPYDANYRQWCLDKTAWRNAIDRRFDKTGSVYDVRQDSGVQSLKEMLNNGYILNFATYVYSWQWKTIGNDPATTADDAFAGKSCAFWVNGTSGAHGMTVVGYNDDIWVDVNGNGAVDSGEKGAFRIANSWGTGWYEGGFSWFAYDGLKAVSAVSGGPSASRREGWWYGEAYWITARNYDYQPTMVAEFTINHLKRSQLRMTLGLSDTTRTTPSTTWSPAMINYQGGPYAFNGTTTAVDGTFVFDFTDIAPASTATEYRYYVGMYDSTSADQATLSSFKLIDVLNTNETVCYDVPQVSDASQAYAYVDYYYDNGNARPEANASADPTSGAAPLPVAFDGSLSIDSDGTIVSWNWNFGDGTNGSGETVNHTYADAGTYTATLTVTDNMGGTDSDTVTVTVSPDPTKVMHVEAMSASIVNVSGGKSARVVVTITNPSDSPISGATVQGTWSGLVSGTASGVTGTDGKVTFTSPKTKKSGTFTFRVTNVTKSGYTYDSGQNTITQISISTSAPVNQNPVAVVSADKTSGNSPLTVNFNGSGSYDPDGSVVSHSWNFGDGGSATGSTASNTYNSNGTYTAVLTVTDNLGATDTESVIITVGTPPPASDMYVSDIAMSKTKAGKNNQAIAKVTIRKTGGAAVANATVNGQWTLNGSAFGSSSGVTAADGTVTFTANTKNTGLFVFTVNNVSASGYSYNSALNTETSDSISVP